VFVWCACVCVVCMCMSGCACLCMGVWVWPWVHGRVGVAVCAWACGCPSPSDPLPPRAPKQYTHFSSQASNYSSGVGEGCVCQSHRSERDITQIWTLVRHPFAAASLQAVLCVGQG